MPSLARYAAQSLPPLIAAMLAVVCRGQVITTVAGTGQAVVPGDGGPALSAGVQMPMGIVADSAGDIIFYEGGDWRLREVNTGGIIGTLAGNGTIAPPFGGSLGDGGPATNAIFGSANQFQGVAMDAAGNLYIADPGTLRVRKINTAGIISTFAGGGGVGGGGDGGPATSASLGSPSGIAVDRAGNVYIADVQFGRVRMVNTSGTISTVAGGGSGGDGPATSAALQGPFGLALDSQGNLYIAEGLGGTGTSMRVRKVTPSGTISTVAGGNGIGFSGDGGPATQAQLDQPLGLAVDSAGNLYIADFGNNRVRKVDSSGMIITIAGAGHIAGNSTNIGDGGPPAAASLQPSGLSFDASGNLYISDYSGYRVRKITFGAKPRGLSTSAASLFFAATLAHPAAPSQQLTVESVGGPPISFTAAWSVQSGGNWLTVSGGGTTPQSVTVSPGNGPIPAGTYKGTITITPSTTGYSAITVPVTYTVSAAAPTTPVITDVQNGASFQSAFFSNSIWTVKGTNLASTTDNWNKSIVGGALPTSLDGVTVTFDGYPAYISYISPTQINLMTPNDPAVEAVSVVVNNNGAISSTFTTPGVPTFYSPAFFMWPNNQAVATHTDYTYAVAPGTFPSLATVAAKPGEVIILWGTGFGPTLPPTQDGAVVPGDQAYLTSTLPSVTINNVPATVYAAALAAGYAGLYQVAVQVPASLGNGNWPVIATMGLFDGASSPSSVVLAVHN